MNTFLGDIATQSQGTGTAGGTKTIDKISDILTKVVQPAANVYSTVVNKPGQPASTVPQYIPTTQQAAPVPVPEQKPDNTKKYLLIGGAVILVAGGIYLVTRKKKAK